MGAPGTIRVILAALCGFESRVSATLQQPTFDVIPWSPGAPAPESAANVVVVDLTGVRTATRCDELLAATDTVAARLRAPIVVIADTATFPVERVLSGTVRGYLSPQEVASGLAVVVRAVIARHAEDERLSGFLARARVGWFVTDLDGILVEASAAVADLLGYASPEALRSANAYLDSDALEPLVKRLAQTPGALEDELLRVRNRAGAELYVRVRAVLVDETHGRRMHGMLSDVTAYREQIEHVRGLEAELRELRILLDETGHAMYAVDAAGNNVQTSNAELKMLGYADPTELLGKPRAESHYLVPGDRSRFVQEIESSGKVERYPALFVRKGGREPVWVEGNCRRVVDSTGALAGVRGFIRDVTEASSLQRYGDALSRINRESTRVDDIPPIVCRAVVEAMVAHAVLFVVVDPHSDVLVVQHADWAAGFEPIAVEGRYFKIEPRTIDASVAELDCDGSFPLREFVKKHGTATERLLTRPVGRSDSNAFVWVFGTHNPVSGDRRTAWLDRFLEEVALTMETAIERQVNRLYRAIQAALRQRKGRQRGMDDFLHRGLQELRAEVPFDAGSIFRLGRHSPRRLRLAATTGIEGSPRKESVFYDVGEGLTGGVASTNALTVCLEVDTLHEPKFFERTAGPRRFWVGLPIRLPDGEVGGVLRVLNRVRQRAPCPFTPWDFRILEAAAEQTALVFSLEGAAEQSSELLERVMHELRAPANTIRANIDLIIRHRLSGERLERKFDDLLLDANVLLDVARGLETVFGDQKPQEPAKDGTISRDDRPANVREVLNAVVHLLRPELRSGGADAADVKLDLERLPFARVGKSALTQVFFNLFQNAVRYSRKRTGHHKLTVEVVGRVAANKIVVNFRDWGIGILEEDRERIFELGVRGANAHIAQARGTGLGLAICRQLVQASGGLIMVTALKNPTELTLVLPVQP